jgi:hypothetical protein
MYLLYEDLRQVVRTSQVLFCDCHHFVHFNFTPEFRGSRTVYFRELFVSTHESRYFVGCPSSLHRLLDVASQPHLQNQQGN